MFGIKYEKRLKEWIDFREDLEIDPDPLNKVIDNYENAPRSNMQTDPWTPEMWPNPWELISENQYDDFCRVLGMCYSLQLTDRFKGSKFEIHIGIDRSKSNTHYLLVVDDNYIINWEDGEFITTSSLPDTFVSQNVYHMPGLQ